MLPQPPLVGGHAGVAPPPIDVNHGLGELVMVGDDVPEVDPAVISPVGDLVERF